MRIIITFILIVGVIVFIWAGVTFISRACIVTGIALGAAIILVNALIINLPGRVTVKVLNGQSKVTERTVDFKIPFVQKAFTVDCRQQSTHHSAIRVCDKYYNIAVTYQVNRDEIEWIAKNVTPRFYLYSNFGNLVEKTMAASSIETCINADGDFEDAVMHDLQNAFDKKYKEGVITIKDVEINTIGSNWH